MRLEPIVFKSEGIYISDATFLTCLSSSGAEEQLDFSQIITRVKTSRKTLSAKEYTELILAEEHLFVKPKDFIPLEGTFCFFQGATHTIIAESKEGKTTFAVAELSKSSKKVIILDGDSNSTTAIERAGNNVQWMQPTDPDGLVEYYLSVVEKGIDFSDYVFVIDSLQNFTNTRDLDSNNGMKEIILRLKKLTHTGATLVILHHVTATNDTNKPLKPKGNSEVLYSSSDVVYGFYRDTGLTAIRSRIEGITNGQHLGYGKTLNSSQVKDDL